MHDPVLLYIFTCNHISGRWKYLTHWNVVIQITYYITNGILTFVDIDLPVTKYIRSKIFFQIILPLSYFVSIFFWGLYLIDRELVLPQEMDKFITPYFNNQKHTFIILCTTLEMLLINHQPMPEYRSGIPTIVAFSSAYMLWLAVVYWNSGIWVYGILEILNLQGKLLFCIFANVLFVSVYTCLYYLGRLINGTHFSSYSFH